MHLQTLLSTRRHVRMESIIVVLGYFGLVTGPDTAYVAPNSWPKQTSPHIFTNALSLHPPTPASCSTWQLRNVAQPYAQTLTAGTRERNRKDVLSRRLPELPRLGTGIGLKKTIKMKHGPSALTTSSALGVTIGDDTIWPPQLYPVIVSDILPDCHLKRAYT
jgi:hypothetical protein